ncbi:hypothetical protein [Emticicia sp. 21SJ11W-3]|uniref:hypothetical protein n=1 Tax=Emticicia sp. 21SJ11W-3 TaxID=2916755 RepID=UPI00209F2DF1|nr:hypothetical protein [Emticicia sp. 21SJ11W-3]UTA66958.1 hypothetical protein MB380_15260 [Emticicia sp. 21SJ11W-3]
MDGILVLTGWIGLSKKPSTVKDYLAALGFLDTPISVLTAEKKGNGHHLINTGNCVYLGYTGSTHELNIWHYK